MFYARKRSGSGKCFMRESEATAANVLCVKAKRQRQVQKSPTSIGGEINAVLGRLSASVQTSAEIEELWLRSSHPVKTPE